jgi:hypothetical protein
MRSGRVGGSALAGGVSAALVRPQRPAFAAGAVLVASRVRGGKSLRWESLPRACASLSWLAAQQPSSPIGRVAAPACLSHRFARFTRCAAFRAVSQNPNPRGRRHPKKQTAPSSGATTGIHDFAAGPLSTRTPWYEIAYISKALSKSLDTACILGYNDHKG